MKIVSEIEKLAQTRRNTAVLMDYPQNVVGENASKHLNRTGNWGESLNHQVSFQITTKWAVIEAQVLVEYNNDASSIAIAMIGKVGIGIPCACATQTDKHFESVQGRGRFISAREWSFYSP